MKLLCALPQAFLPAADDLFDDSLVSGVIKQETDTAINICPAMDELFITETGIK